MEQPVFKRVLLKISGEALAGDKHFGLDFQVMGRVADVIKQCVDMGVQVGIVIGGGNFWRGVKDGEGHIERTRADHMGMLATAMNCMAMADVLEQKGVDVRVQTALEIRAVAAVYPRQGHSAPGKGESGHFWLRHRLPVFLHGYRGGTACSGDRRGRHPAGQEHRRRVRQRPGQERRRSEV